MKKIEKKVYTVEEVDELKKWFDNQTLPQSMQINSSAYSPDLKDTVAMLFEQAYICCNNPKMQGCLLLLENIKKNLEEKKINPFQMTYQDGTYLYMAVGYGEQKTGGYSILVKKMTETKDKIFLNTELRGPSKEETVLEKPSFPYVVIKIENISKEVVFEAH